MYLDVPSKSTRMRPTTTAVFSLLSMMEEVSFAEGSFSSNSRAARRTASYRASSREARFSSLMNVSRVSFTFSSGGGHS